MSTDDSENGGRKSPGDPAAAAFAMGAANADPQTAARLRTYLDEQTHLAHLQAEDLKEERKLRHWSLVVRHFSDVMKALFELAVALIVLIILVALGSAIWSAANDSGLVIEAFSVPPDLSARGLTGQVVAAQLQDKLTSLQRQTVSARAASSYQNNWGSDIKVQIPETGVSIGEFYNYLRQWLGHETRISGEVFRNANGIAVTARAGNGQGQTFRGKEGDLDTLVQKAAEAVYGQTQPYRYAVYLMNRNRNKEAAAVYTTLSANSDPHERAWAYIGLANLAQQRGDFSKAIALARRAIANNPQFVLGNVNLAQYEAQLQHQEASYQAQRALDRFLRDDSEADVNPASIPSTRLQNDQQIAESVSDYQKGIAIDKAIRNAPDFNSSTDIAQQGDIQIYAFMHDPASMQRVIDALPPPPDAPTRLNHDLSIFFGYATVGKWRQAIAMRPVAARDLANLGPIGRVVSARIVDPLMAYSLATGGDYKAANAMIASTPMDCDLCLRSRGYVAAAQKNWNGALHWFSLEAARTPSLPQGYSDWGWALLQKGDPAGAIQKLAIANARGPHFADPLAWWGEALMAQNRSDLALEKFAQAAQYAPNWGRLHMKWGEALWYAGRKDEARKQFAIAAHLFLSEAEQRELSLMRARG